MSTMCGLIHSPAMNSVDESNSLAAAKLAFWRVHTLLASTQHINLKRLAGKQLLTDSGYLNGTLDFTRSFYVNRHWYGDDVDFQP